MSDNYSNELIDKNGMFTKPITYSKFKTSLDEGGKNILAEYEGGIIDFFSILEENAFLKKEFADDVVERIKKFAYTDVYSNQLINNTRTLANKLLDIKSRTRFNNIATNEGFQIDYIDEQVMMMIGVSYVYQVESLKRNMLLLIDFDKIGVSKPNEKSFGTIVYKLGQNKNIKESINKNIFYEFLSAKTRNALAHHSYYFENSKMHLCIKGPFDPEPSTIEFDELTKESRKMNVLLLAFYLIYVSKFFKTELD